MEVEVIYKEGTTTFYQKIFGRVSSFYKYKWRDDTQHDDTQHNDTQDKICAPLMLSFKFFSRYAEFQIFYCYAECRGDPWQGLSC
jgi:hypothetical protein